MNGYAESIMSDVNSCDEHKAPFAFEDIARDIYSFDGCSCEWGGEPACETYCDRAGVGIFRLKDHRIAVVHEDEDTSGHG